MSSGRGSWYSQYNGKYQWVDDGDTPESNALGVPDSAQGISFYANTTLGKWFDVTAPNGKHSTEQQTDIGPNPRTGREIDISSAAAERFGYSPDDFPTDGVFHWQSVPAPAVVVGLSSKQQAVKYRDLRKVAAVVVMPKAIVSAYDVNDIIRVMHAHDCAIDAGDNLINIAYVEGADNKGDDAHLTPNANRPDAFDSQRIVFQIAALGGPKILGTWNATTHAGRYYEQIHLLNPGGAFHIATGRQTAWVMGDYHGYEALKQVAPLYGTRDRRKNFLREGPVIHEVVGAHHHWGYDYSKDSVQNSAAGCQVGEMEHGHLQFIEFCKHDSRYQNDDQFMWSSSVLPVEWFEAGV